MVEPKRRAYFTKGTFGDHAPPNTIPFPKHANMTVAEILTFLPNSINCADVIYRMISNGGTRKAIHAMINTHRDFEVEWSVNCCGAVMYKTMDRAGYTEWTIKKHGLWHDSRKDSWNAQRLDVGNLQTRPGGLATAVPFRRLAENVRTMPQGDDALDLTRMVQYCLQNAEDGWTYPKDYEELLDLLGGPLEVRQENTDEAVFHRWEDKKAPPPLPKPERLPHGNELYDRWKKTGRSSVVREKEASTKNVSPRPGALVRRSASGKSTQVNTDNAGAASVFKNVLEPESTDGTPYARALVSRSSNSSSQTPVPEGKMLIANQAEYVSPPSDIASIPSSSTTTHNSRAEDFARKSDFFDADAFGGPRRRPPYRSLSQIGQPKPWDISGWAENLRWAFEQRVLFAKEHPEAGLWNESPEHVACIERERIQRVWASDELLEQLLESD
ncbi:hypothetical protein OPT61_g7095 [Boeremia exigua]|uniref:Uncharacterized protein n=1 Tax=Boeremia exigua TaxID=749465 RepID=A0ACC2I3N9_9PLEO|nr:hypothetical protein OPT61_g7095 [Boeremia exigua]